MSAKRSFTHETPFRHYPFSKSRKHVRVIVFGTSGEMQRYIQWVCPPRAKWRPKSYVGGVFLTWSVKGACIGTIVLCRKHLTPEIIAHESAHAAWEIARSVKMPLDTANSDVDEWFARTHGQLVGTIHKRTAR